MVYYYDYAEKIKDNLMTTIEENAIPILSHLGDDWAVMQQCIITRCIFNRRHGQIVLKIISSVSGGKGTYTFYQTIKQIVNIDVRSVLMRVYSAKSSTFTPA